MLFLLRKKSAQSITRVSITVIAGGRESLVPTQPAVWVRWEAVRGHLVALTLAAAVLVVVPAG